MPSKLRIDELDWCWFYAPQISCEVDPEIKKYLLSLNVDEIMQRLSDQLKIPEYNLFLLRMAHHLLVEGVRHGFTLFQIASLIARTVEDEPSYLEKVVKAAEENAYRTIEMKSNRLNSRGNSRSVSMGSRSGSFHSPTRIRPFPSASSISRDASDSVYESGSTEDSGSTANGATGSNVDLALYGIGRLNKFIEEMPDFSTTKRHRVIHSAANLEALGWAHNSSTSNSGTPAMTPDSGSQYRAFAASLQQQKKNGSTGSPLSLQQPQPQRASTLSVENVEKLTSSLIASGNSSNNSINNINKNSNNGHSNSGNNDGDDFYLAELSPHEPCSKDAVGLDLGPSEEEQGIALGLTAEARGLAGSKLVIMHSVDSGATAARLRSPRAFSTSSSRSSSGSVAKPVPNSRFSCGRLDEEDSSECSHSFKSHGGTNKVGTSSNGSANREVSAPIMIPTPSNLSPESDTTSCEASSKESEGSSPRSFGDNFFLYSESLLHRTNVPFGRVNATEYVGLVHGTAAASTAATVGCASSGSAFALASGSGTGGGSGKERPFPPRSTPPSSQTELNKAGGNNTRNKNGVASSSMAAFSNSNGNSSSGSDEDPETDIETQEHSYASGAKQTKQLLPRDASQASLSKGGRNNNSNNNNNNTNGSVTPVSLQRVASFNAFESPAIYEDKTHSRQMKMLYREQRKTVSKTSEFLELRLTFAKQSVKDFIDKERGATKSRSNR